MKKIFFTVFLLLFQVIYVFARNSQFEISKTRFTSRHKPVIVMGTDDGYAKPTATSITSIKGSTSDNKGIIVLYNDLSAGNIDMLERLSDESTTVVTRKIDEKFKNERKSMQQVGTFWFKKGFFIRKFSKN